MRQRQFTSFDEIDERLKILKLQREIDQESIKLNWNRTKSGLNPANILGNIGGLLPKLIISFMAGKLMKRLRS
ncbi:DUF6327 family protein [Flavobacteriaceae bacterium F89]|uniref:DUF6327 family protein n=1 Tax=Cerina litoralis TaxID=2874477 RepID=A0AAE3EQH4_9FLAO|nr:DUF6327 family protein [Cerina litoralis]MCG2459215.1 DUF6327 family protein [Cerina litoralis]